MTRRARATAFPISKAQRARSTASHDQHLGRRRHPRGDREELEPESSGIMCASLMMARARRGREDLRRRRAAENEGAPGSTESNRFRLKRAATDRGGGGPEPLSGPIDDVRVYDACTDGAKRQRIVRSKSLQEIAANAAETARGQAETEKIRGCFPRARAPADVQHAERACSDRCDERASAYSGTCPP